MTTRRMLITGAVCAALVAAACALDARVASWVRESGLEQLVRHRGAGKTIATLAKAPGNFLFWLVPIAMLCLWHPIKFYAGGFLCLANVMGLVTDIIKWIVGRTRPFRLHEELGYPEPFSLRPFREGLVGLFNQTNLAFPSGHSTTAFASAAAMAILLPRWRWAFYAVAAIVAAERVAENAHYLSDTIAGAGLAIIGVHILWRSCQRIFRERDAKAKSQSVTLSELHER